MHDIFVGIKNVIKIKQGLLFILLNE